MNLITKIKGNSNNKVIFTNSLGAFAAKGLALAVSFFTVPAYIDYFHDNVVLGIWYTVLSVIIWALNFDLGIGNGVRNLLVKAFAAKDYNKAKQIISSGLFANGLVTFFITAIGGVILASSNLHTLLNVPPGHVSDHVLTISVVMVFVAIMLRFFLTTISAVFYAMQKSMVNNFLALTVSILQLLYVLLFHFESVDEALIWLSVSYIITSNLPMAVAGLCVFCTKLHFCAPSFNYIDRSVIKSVMTLGVFFSLCQVLYMVIMNTNEFFITYYFGAEKTVEYTFYHKIFFLVSGILTLAVTPVWSMVTKAFAEKQYAWLKKLLGVFNFVGLSGIMAMFIIVPFLQQLMDLWLGKRAPVVELSVSIAFAAFTGTFLYSSLISTIANGLARIKLQVLCFLIGVILKIVIILIYAPTSSSWELVVWSNFIILGPYCVLQYIDLYHYFNKTNVIENSQNEN